MSANLLPLKLASNFSYKQYMKINTVRGDFLSTGVDLALRWLPASSLSLSALSLGGF